MTNRSVTTSVLRVHKYTHPLRRWSSLKVLVSYRDSHYSQSRSVVRSFYYVAGPFMLYSACEFFWISKMRIDFSNPNSASYLNFGRACLLLEQTVRGLCEWSVMLPTCLYHFMYPLRNRVLAGLLNRKVACQLGPVNWSVALLLHSSSFMSSIYGARKTYIRGGLPNGTTIQFDLSTFTQWVLHRLGFFTDAQSNFFSHFVELVQHPLRFDDIYQVNGRIGFSMSGGLFLKLYKEAD